MNIVTLHFKADNQQLTALDGLYKLASNTVEYVKASFTLGENWTGFDVVRAAWYTDFECISTVLDGNGECFVPWEVLSRPEGVTINLYGCDLEEESDGEAVLVDRLTTYPVKAILVDVDARVCGSETKPVTPSQFEQYIAIVQELVGTVRDITSCVLNPDYTLTIYYSDGTSDTVGPIRGEKGATGATGATGNGIQSIAKIGTAGLVDTYRITYTNGSHYDYTVTNGAQGPQGNGIVSIYKSGESGAVKTYTILFTNGDTYEYQVTDGEVTLAQFEQAFPTDSASGAIASFPDGSDLFYLKSCEVTLEPIQDLSHGDPSPSNICPISGRSSVGVTNGGKNFLSLTDKTFEQYEEYEVDEIPIGTYTYSAVVTSTDTDANKCSIIFLDKDKNILTSKALDRSVGGARISVTGVTFSNPCKYVRLYASNGWPSGAGDTANFIDNQLELGSTATTYEPYTADTHTIPLGQTVYGGTLDCVSGALKCAYALRTFTNADTFSLSGSGNSRFYITDTFSQPLKALIGGDGISSHYTFVKNKTASSYMTVNDTIAVYQGESNYVEFYLKDDRFATAQELNNYVAQQYANGTPIQVLYELNVPIENTTDPTTISTLYGNNNVWSDGAVEVEYVADTQLWVEKKLAE